MTPSDRVVLGDVLRARKSFANPDILTKGDVVIVQALTDDGCVYFQNLFRCSPQAGLRLDWFDFVHRPPTRLKADYSHMSAAPAPSSLARVVSAELMRIATRHRKEAKTFTDDGRDIADATLAALPPEAPARDGDAHSVAVGRLTWAANTHPDPEKRALLTVWAEECQAALTPRHEAPAEGAGELDDDDATTYAPSIAGLSDYLWNQALADESVEGRCILEGWREAVDALRARSSAPEAREGEAWSWVKSGTDTDGDPVVFTGIFGDYEGRVTLSRNDRSWSATANRGDGKLGFPSESAGMAYIEEVVARYLPPRIEAARKTLALYTHPAAPSADKLRIAVEALEPFALIGAHYRTGGLRQDIESRAPSFMRMLDFKAFRHADQALAALKAGPK